MCEPELVAVAGDVRDPVDDESLRNDPVIIDALIADDGAEKPRLKLSLHRIFAHKRWRQIPKIGAIVFDVKRKRPFLQPVVPSPLLPAPGHDTAEGIFCVRACETPQV